MNEFQPTKEEQLLCIKIDRDRALQEVVFEQLHCSEDLIKSMAVLYMITPDDQPIKWITVSNETKVFTKQAFGKIIKDATEAIGIIYFKARLEKDKILTETE